MSEVQQYAARAPGTASSPSATRPPSTARSSVAARHSPDGARRASVWALTTAAVASLLASSCCLLPLLLVSVGLSGAWLGSLRILQPYSPILTGIAVVALAFAGQSLRRSSSCPVGSAPSRSLYKGLFSLIAALTLIVLVTPLIAPWFY